MMPEEQYSELTNAIAKDRIEMAARQVVLAIIDELWADYLDSVGELKGGIHWISWGGGDPLYKFLSGVQEIYSDFCRFLEREIAETFSTAEIRNGGIHFRKKERLDSGATWTYITTDQPFGTATERLMKGLRRKLSNFDGRRGS